MEVQPLRISALKADRKAAQVLTGQLLAMTTSTGKKPFRQVDTDTGWQVTFPYKKSDGSLERGVAFEFRALGIGHEVHFDPRIVKI